MIVNFQGKYGTESIKMIWKIQCRNININAVLYVLINLLISLVVQIMTSDDSDEVPLSFEDDSTSDDEYEVN